MASTFIPRGCRRGKQREAVEAEAATIAAAAAASRDDKKWKRSFSADRCYPTAFLTATLLDQKLAKPWKAIFSERRSRVGRTGTGTKAALKLAELSRHVFISIVTTARTTDTELILEHLAQCR